MARACCTVEKLAAFSQRELGRHKAPKVINLAENSPKSPLDKVQRLNLLEFRGLPQGIVPPHLI